MREILSAIGENMETVAMLAMIIICFIDAFRR